MCLWFQLLNVQSSISRVRSKAEAGAFLNMRTSIVISSAVALTAAVAGLGQTRLDLGNQGQNYDFSGAGFTRPVQTGTTLPQTCSTGQLFYNTATLPGGNLFGCTVPGVWTLESSSAANFNTIVSPDGSVIPIIAGSSLDLSVNEATVATVSGNSDLTGSNRMGLGGNGFVSITLPNETVTGTSLYGLASVSTASSAIQSPAGAATGVVGIVVSGDGTTGNARIAIHGFATCVFDGATNAGDYVQASVSAAGECTDVGAIRPGTRQVLGYVTTTNGGPGSYPVLLAPDVVGASGGSINARSELQLPLVVCAGSSHPVLTWSVPPAPATAATAGGCTGINVADGYASFASSGTPSLQYSVTLPQTLTGPADVYLNFSSPTAGGTFTPALDVTCEATDGSAAGDAPWTPNDFFAPGALTTPQGAQRTTTGAVTGLTWPTGCVAGSRAHFRLIRTDTTGTAGTVNVSEVVVVFRRTL